MCVSEQVQKYKNRYPEMGDAEIMARIIVDNSTIKWFDYETNMFQANHIQYKVIVPTILATGNVANLDFSNARISRV